MLIKILPTSLQIFCKTFLNSIVIVKSLRRQFLEELISIDGYWNAITLLLLQHQLMEKLLPVLTT